MFFSEAVQYQVLSKLTFLLFSTKRQYYSLVKKKKPDFRLKGKVAATERLTVDDSDQTQTTIQIYILFNWVVLWQYTCISLVKGLYCRSIVTCLYRVIIFFSKGTSSLGIPFIGILEYKFNQGSSQQDSRQVVSRQYEVGLVEGLLTSIEILMSSYYELGSEANTGSCHLLLYISSLPLLLSPIFTQTLTFLLPSYQMSQHNIVEQLEL